MTQLNNSVLESHFMCLVFKLLHPALFHICSVIYRGFSLQIIYKCAHTHRSMQLTSGRATLLAAPAAKRTFAKIHFRDIRHWSVANNHNSPVPIVITKLFKKSTALCILVENIHNIAEREAIVNRTLEFNLKIDNYML